jgi:hypothetical protein
METLGVLSSGHHRVRFGRFFLVEGYLTASNSSIDVMRRE